MERMVVVCRKDGRKEEGTQEHKKREIQTGKGDIFLGDEEFIYTARTNCGVCFINRGLRGKNRKKGGMNQHW